MTNPVEYYWIGAGATERKPLGAGTDNFPLRYASTTSDHWHALSFNGAGADERYNGARFGDVFSPIGAPADADSGGISGTIQTAMTGLYCAGSWMDGTYDLHLHVEIGLDNPGVARNIAVFMLRVADGNDEFIDALGFGKEDLVTPGFHADDLGVYPTVDLLVPDLAVTSDEKYYFAIGDDEPNQFYWISGGREADVRGYLRMEYKS